MLFTPRFDAHAVERAIPKNIEIARKTTASPFVKPRALIRRQRNSEIHSKQTNKVVNLNDRFKATETRILKGSPTVSPTRRR